MGFSRIQLWLFQSPCFRHLCMHIKLNIEQVGLYSFFLDKANLTPLKLQQTYLRISLQSGFGCLDALIYRNTCQVIIIAPVFIYR